MVSVAVAKHIKKMQQEQSKEDESKEAMKAFVMLVINKANSSSASSTVVNDRDNDIPIPKNLKMILKTLKSGSVDAILATTGKLKSLNILKPTETSKIKLTDKEPPCKKRLPKIISTKDKQSLKGTKQSRS